jgi:uncharacterized delta-60 repeat protein
LAAGAFRGFSLLLLLVLAGNLMAARSAGAQAPLPIPDLELLTNGSVWAIVRQPDGGTVFAGTFSSVNGVERSNIARLRPDGTLDPNWNPSADVFVMALAVDADGAIYAGGAFSNIGGQPRERIAKLSGSTGEADTSWDPSSNGMVYALALSGTGSIYVGGGFSLVGGSPGVNIAKLSAATGHPDPNWQPSFGEGGYVDALAVDASGAVYAGGDFDGIGGQARDRIAKLDGVTGQADANWFATSLGARADRVETLATDASGALYAGGLFGIQKLSGDTGAAIATWKPSTGDVYALAVDTSGAVYVGGDFADIGGRARDHIAKLSGSTGEALADWNPGANYPVLALAVDTNGALHAGGSFNRIGGHERFALATLSPAGDVFGIANDVESPGAVAAIAVQPNGGMIVGGYFQKAGQTSRKYILRLRADGTLDPQWNPGADSAVRELAVDANDSVYAAGAFSRIGGQQIGGLAKLSGGGSGSADANWNPSPDGYVNALAVDATGAVYVAGNFTHVGGLARLAVAKLSASTGAADATWNAGVDCCAVNALAFAADGSVYVGGSFYGIGGLSRQGLAKVSAQTGLADPSWDASCGGTIDSLAADTSGALYAGGRFDFIGGQERRLIAKLSSDGHGAADANWSAGLGWGYNYLWEYVAPLTIDANGTVYAGGFFTIDFSSETYIAKLSGVNGTIDRDWNPFRGLRSNIPVAALVATTNGAINIGGYFETAGGEPRYGFAAFATTWPNPIFVNGFEESR